MSVIIRRRPAPKPVAAAPEVPASAPLRKRVAVPLRKAAPAPPPAVQSPGSDHGASDTDYVAVIHRYQAKVRNPMTAIRAKCVECSGGQLKEVNSCPIKTCALWPFRMGVNPMHKRSKAHQGNQDSTGDEE